MSRRSTKKSSRGGTPQISIASWILGGPIVVRPRLHPLPPVLVTTEALKAPKKAQEVKRMGKVPDNPAGKPGENGNKTAQDGAAPAEKADEVETDTASKSNEKIKTNSQSDNTWTAEQDALLLRLKATNTSWKDIASQMSPSKSTLQARYKELQKIPSASTTPPAMVTDTENKANNGNANFVNGNWNQDNSAEAGGFWDSSHLKSDYNWTREDCEILEMLELRYREEKWLSIQASFYNMTGRMIAAEIIREKLSEEGH